MDQKFANKRAAFLTVYGYIRGDVCMHYLVLIYVKKIYEIRQFINRVDYLSNAILERTCSFLRIS